LGQLIRKVRPITPPRRLVQETEHISAGTWIKARVPMALTLRRILDELKRAGG